MEIQFTLMGLFALICCLFVYEARLFLHFHKWRTTLRIDDTRLIATLVVFVNNVPVFFEVQRSDPYSLTRDGLTIANLINVGGSIVIGAISIYFLMAARRLKHDLFTGPSFWLMLLFALYLTSTSWSLYPEGTAFRAGELIAFYVVAVFIFTGQRPFNSLYWVMTLQIMLGSVPLIPDGLSELQNGRLVGFMQSNQYALYSATFLLLHYHLYRVGWSGYLFGLFFLVAFGSTATFAAFFAAAATYFVYSYSSGIWYIFRIPITVSIVCFCVSFIFFPDIFVDVINIAAPLLQKDVEAFYTASGRLELWQFYSSYLKDFPFGIGLWSERVFSGYGVNVPWSATNAHNGFLSAWIGAGVPAFVCLSLVYMSTIMRLRHQDMLVQRICYSLLVMLFVNSMTFPGIGGNFSMWYFVLTTIIVVSNLSQSEARRIGGISPMIDRSGRVINIQEQS